jgi:GT2 family glycosyltransferase
VLADRGGPVLAISVFNAYDDLVESLGAMLRHASPETDVLVVDDGSTDERVSRLPERLGNVSHRVAFLASAEHGGFVRAANRAPTSSRSWARVPSDTSP